MPVALHFRTAFRARFRRQIKAGTVAAVCNKFAVLAFGADIMRAEGFTSDMPDIVATNDEPTLPREPTR